MQVDPEADPFAAIRDATNAHRAMHAGCGAYPYSNGALLGALAAAVSARRILELGTALGYIPEAAWSDFLHAAASPCIVLDQSRPELDLSVVKVMVPGLRHFWRRLGPGRLWDVPAALGRTPRATDEDSINPLSVFF